jgi:DNA-binding MarR family transcriptional regulator
VDSDALGDEIVWRLLNLFRRMNEVFEEVATDAGLSTAEAGVLRRLDKPASMRSFADAMGCDASYITLLTDRLEALGLVDRVPDPQDRRVKQLSLTAKGRRARRSLTKRVLATSPALVPLDAAAREQLLELLRRLGDEGTPTP